MLGIINPRIYLPFSMNEQDLEHVVAHEQAHIRRKDHWWKPLGFLLLTIYWFNPLMWLAYVLLCRDIELACDEKVIKELGNEQRADYTQALVVCSVNRRMIAACPLAFGEVGVKDRVKSVIGLLYGIAFTIKMSKKEDHQIDGYFDYVVPPLEGFWWQGERRPGDAMLRTDRAGRRDGVPGIDYARKEDFKWISVIRLPDFVTREDFDWAVRKATAKKKQDFSKVEFISYEEDLCVQCMHIGLYDDEPVTVDAMHRYMEEQGYTLDITDQRMHHEIYLSDARKVAPEKLKTVIRHPIKRA